MGRNCPHSQLATAPTAQPQTPVTAFLRSFSRQSPRPSSGTEPRLARQSSSRISGYLGGQSFSWHFFCLPLGCVSGSQNVAFTMPWPFFMQWAVWRRIPGGQAERFTHMNPEPACSASGPWSCQVITLIAGGKVVPKVFNLGSSYHPCSCYSRQWVGGLQIIEVD